MQSTNQDARIGRLWYLHNSYDQDATRGDWDSVCSEGGITGQDWNRVSNWDSVKKVPYIFFSRAPLTFAHSQLVIPAPPGQKNSGQIDEAKFFKWAACLIKRAIITFSKALYDKRVHTDGKYKGLAEVTRTEGNYLKTLIVRASASEKIGLEYKVHLVPYFESHRNECAERFKARHRIPAHSVREGGLLGWLGERENQVDEWEVNSLWKFKLDEIANNDLGMVELAKCFRSLW